MAHTLVLLRHGESTWNKENRFTGWTDVDLSEKGRVEAKEAGQVLKSAGYSFDVPPPPLDDDDEFSQARDVRYADLGDELPRTECLKDVIGRLLPYWDGPLSDDLRSGQTVLVAAHGNSLRAIVKHLDGICDDDIAALNIPTGMPLVYELDDDLKPLNRYYLGDPEKVKAAMDAVAAQGKKK